MTLFPKHVFKYIFGSFGFCNLIAINNGFFSIFHYKPLNISVPFFYDSEYETDCRSLYSVSLHVPIHFSVSRTVCVRFNGYF